jgi:hypothetical protein
MRAEWCRTSGCRGSAYFPRTPVYGCLKHYLKTAISCHFLAHEAAVSMCQYELQKASPINDMGHFGHAAPGIAERVA